MQDAYYLEIDEFPLQNWINCNKGDLTATRKPATGGVTSYFKRSGKHSQDNDMIAWGKLYDDFLKKVGLGDEFEELVSLIKERIELQIDYLEDKRNGKRVRAKLNAINQVTYEIQRLTQKAMKPKGDSSGGITKTLNLISKKQGYHLQVSQLTTLAYFDLLKAYNAGEL